MIGLTGGALALLAASNISIPPNCYATPGPGCESGQRVHAHYVVRPELRQDTLALIRLIDAVQKADYEGNLRRLGEIYDSMATFIDEPALAKHARYWRGFALWRRALNSLSQEAGPQAVDADFALANEEFREALRLDSAYVEARIGLVAGLSNRVFFNRNDPALQSRFVREYRPVLDALAADVPTNPRFLFVAAPQLFHAPAEVGGSRQRALDMIDRAIQQQPAAEDSAASGLEPRWGAAELHMLMAVLLLRAGVELDRAERHARHALAMRPHWRAVRENLLPAIQSKR